MKKFTFRRCTVIAAVFAACLFAVGCKPNTQTPPTNPGSTPGGSSSGSSSSGSSSSGSSSSGSSSISVQPPAASSVTPGASTQTPGLPTPQPEEKTVPFTFTLKTIDRPAAIAYYGIATHIPDGGLQVIVQVPEKIKDDTEKRKVHVRAQLVARLKMDYKDADYNFYTAVAGTGNPAFNKDDTIYVGQTETPMKVPTKVSFKTLTSVDAAASPTHMKASFPSLGKTLTLSAKNNEPLTDIGSRIRATVKALLAAEFGGATEYKTWEEASGTNDLDIDTECPDDTTTTKEIFVGKKIEYIAKTVTVQSVNGVTAGTTAILNGGPWEITVTCSYVSPAPAGVDNLPIPSDNAAVNSKLKLKMQALLGTTENYKFFADEDGKNPLDGETLNTASVIYVSKP